MNAELYTTIENEYKGKNAHRFNQSFFVPHVDGSIGLDQLTALIEQTYDMGTVDRIEWVPKINQADGHAYYQAFVYMNVWGTGYFAQHVRNQLMRGIYTPMYYTSLDGQQRFVKCCANRSELAWLPHPEHTDVRLTVEEGVIDADQLTALIEMDYEWGKVHHVDVSPARPSVDADDEYVMVVDMVIHMEYWYHTESAYICQEMMRRHWYVKTEYTDLVKMSQMEETKEEPLQKEVVSMIFFACAPTTGGINPFVYVPQRVHANADVEMGIGSYGAYGKAVNQKHPPNLQCGTECGPEHSVMQNNSIVLGY